MAVPWVEDELDGIDLGDERLNGRAVKLLSALGERPNLSLPAACGGRADLEAAYRFCDNAKVTFAKVLQPHHERTRQRLAAQAVALLVQDATEAEVTRPGQEVVGVGELDGARRGFWVHVLHAFTPGGTPLGTAAAEVLNRTAGVSHAPAAEKHRRRHGTPIEEKESLRWLTGLRQARELAQQAPATQCVYVADSEADIFELFAEPRGERPLHWLIRAGQDRALHGPVPGHVRDRVLATPVLYRVGVRVRERQAKTAVEDRARRRERPARVADLEVRAARVHLRPPWRPGRQLPPVAVNVVWVREPHPPSGAEPVEWALLTTPPIDTPEQVRTVVAYYCVRWGIEVCQADCRPSDRLYLGGRAA